MKAGVSPPLDFVPVVIIGAGRSGTNALRDMLCDLPDFATWNCDEINPIWRHGNLFQPNDEIPENRATPAVKTFIRRAFLRIWKSSGRPKFVVEKTCANSLRVPFVDAVLPQAKYIHIIRSGPEVVKSAQKRWRGELEFPGLPYFLAKIRYTPVFDLPVYGATFLRNRLRLLLGKQKRMRVWGPRFSGMSQLADADLQEICTRQWIACVQNSDDALENIDRDRVMIVRYEDLTVNPGMLLTEILSFLNTECDTKDAERAASLIRTRPDGQKTDLFSGMPADLQTLMHPTMKAHGYID